MCECHSTTLCRLSHRATTPPPTAASYRHEPHPPSQNSPATSQPAALLTAAAAATHKEPPSSKSLPGPTHPFMTPPPAVGERRCHIILAPLNPQGSTLLRHQDAAVTTNPNPTLQQKRSRQHSLTPPPIRPPMNHNTPAPPSHTNTPTQSRCCWSAATAAAAMPHPQQHQLQQQAAANTQLLPSPITSVTQLGIQTAAAQC